MSESDFSPFENELADLLLKHKVKDSQAAVGLAGALLTAGLSASSAAEILTVGQHDFNGDDAEAIKSGIIYLLVSNIEDEDGKTFEIFGDVLFYLIARKAVTLPPETRSDIVGHLAVFFGCVAAQVIDSLMSERLTDDALDQISKRITNDCIKSVMATTVAAAMTVVAAKEATSEESTSDKA